MPLAGPLVLFTDDSGVVASHNRFGLTNSRKLVLLLGETKLITFVSVRARKRA